MLPWGGSSDQNETYFRAQHIAVPVAYFDGLVIQINILIDGEMYFFVQRLGIYRIAVFYHHQSSGVFFYRQIDMQNDPASLSEVNKQIRSAFITDYPDFNATLALVVTHNLSVSSKPNIFQSVLVSDEKSTFMIFNYGELSAPSRIRSFKDTRNNENRFNCSTSSTNCGTPGRFIFSARYDTFPYELTDYKSKSSPIHLFFSRTLNRSFLIQNFLFDFNTKIEYNFLPFGHEHGDNHFTQVNMFDLEYGYLFPYFDQPPRAIS